MGRQVLSVVKSEKNYVVEFSDGTISKLYILNDHVFRYHYDGKNDFFEYPIPQDKGHVAKIVLKSSDDYEKNSFNSSVFYENHNNVSIETNSITISIDKSNNLITVFSKILKKIILKEIEPIYCADGLSKQTLSQDKDEYFYGGGTQNGRFTHKGEIIYIENTNNWEDGGVASPNPFYWSSKGYGVLRNTWQPGKYDFGSSNVEVVKTQHSHEIFDAFFFINHVGYVGVLQDNYELTGNPVLIPEYSLYQAHFNAYNRDYWVEVTNPEHSQEAIRFEDGKFYCEFQPNDLKNQNGILESLNGEENNYQFSARAVIDRYKRNDMPLGWFIPNDGYEAGYGQTCSLEGDIENLKMFVDYCELNNVKVGLWTESNLHPKDSLRPKKNERDIVREVEIAGIVALKTDMAWVGSGYSFGLNGIEEAANIFVEKTQGKVRPLIITVDGWAGTQRHAAVWSGDQTGGKWENIRFHIPTLIGTSLSGQPNVGSDIDGIFGGRNKEVNVRDFQWKAFTPIQTNMDGWGENPKTPFEFDEEATEINRAYLKLKSMLLPYNYSIAYESTKGLPMIRAMLLEYPNEVSAYTKDSQYQYMWGPYFLVAPVYNDLKDDNGFNIRNGIYLPDRDQIWIDFFTGEKYEGGKIINNIEVPLWKLPLYIKAGAIIPVSNCNNNPSQILRDCRIFIIYPNGESEFTLYEDDGISIDYLSGWYAKTKITCSAPKWNRSGVLNISVSKTEGNYKDFQPRKMNIFYILSSASPEAINLSASNKIIYFEKVKTKSEFDNGQNVYFFDNNFENNPYFTYATKQTCVCVKTEVINTTLTDLNLSITVVGSQNVISLCQNNITNNLPKPENVHIPEDKISPTSLTVEWSRIENALSYDIDRDGMIFKNVKNCLFKFDDFLYSSQHEFRIRAIFDLGFSEWSDSIVCSTLENPYKNVIQGVISYCNYPDQKREELYNLLNNDNKIWHTHWVKGKADPDSSSFIIINFDLGVNYNVSKMKYLPRADAGNGTFLKVQCRSSHDNETWSDYSEIIEWAHDNAAKEINLDKDLRFFELKVLNSVGNFGSGRKILFFKKE